ncbi:hypothetical protein IWW55_006916, partial [Coemansia sp. RSA 2706]
YPHWICQPALRFEHDKANSTSGRLLNEAQADQQAKRNSDEAVPSTETPEDGDSKRQKVATA